MNPTVSHDYQSDAPRPHSLRAPGEDTLAHALLDAGSIDRRGLLIRGAAGLALLGLGSAFLAGCQRQVASDELPGPTWPDPGKRLPAAPSPAQPAPPGSAPVAGIIPRSQWAGGPPITSRMERMLPVRRITVHHSALPTTGGSQQQVAREIEQIRMAHLNRKGEPFGDIGYHYVVDPQGNIWEGRSLQFQGAHVAKQNEGNLGIMCMGNFEVQRPTPAQVASLNRFVVQQMRRYNVPAREVRTHREMAQTLCPGRNLQSIMVNARSRGGAIATG